MSAVNGEAFGIESLADGFADEGDEDERDHDGGKGAVENPGGIHVIGAVLEEAAPGGFARRQAETEEIKGGEGCDEGLHGEGQLGDQD